MFNQDPQIFNKSQFIFNKNPTTCKQDLKTSNQDLPNHSKKPKPDASLRKMVATPAQIHQIIAKSQSKLRKFYSFQNSKTAKLVDKRLQPKFQKRLTQKMYMLNTQP